MSTTVRLQQSNWNLPDGSAYPLTLLLRERSEPQSLKAREPDNVFVSDELIMAFADGELDPPLASHIRRAIHADAALRRKHEIFCSTRVVLARAFDDALEEPVPERLKSAVRPN